MAWYHYLWPWGAAHRQREQDKVDAQKKFEEQLQEVLNRESDLRAATERLKTQRESMGRPKLGVDDEEELIPYRKRFPSFS